MSLCGTRVLGCTARHLVGGGFMCEDVQSSRALGDVGVGHCGWVERVSGWEGYYWRL